VRSLRVLRNVITNYLRFLLAAAIGLLLTPFLVHALGDRDYGLWVTVFSLTGYFGLFDQGIRPSLVRYVSRDHAAGDREGLARTISSAFALYGAVGVLTLAVAAAVAWNAPAWIRIDPALHPVAPTLVLLVGATLALGFPLGVYGAVLSGLQRYDVANGIGMAIGVLRAVVFVAVLRWGGGLVALAWTSLAVNLLGHAWSWFAARRLLPEVPFGPAWVTREHMRRIASYGGWAFIGALATNIAFQTDTLVITSFLGAALATPFALAAGRVEDVRSLVHSAVWVLSPTASEMETKGEHHKLRFMLIAGCKYSVLLSWPVLFGLIVFGENFFVTWMGPAYAWIAALLTVLAVPTLVALPQATASSVLFGISRHKGVVVLSLVSAVLNLALSLWWAQDPRLMRAWFGEVVPPGLMGVAMGTAIPLLLVSGIATAVFACRALAQPLAGYLWEGMLRPGLVAASFLPPALLVQQWWHPVGWLPLLAACAGSWLVFACVAYALAFTPDERVRWARMAAGLFGRVPRPGEASS
jgi:O-antigen/teichoic acid export membrane protein